ncbi:MAG: DUF2760 domain-containing protein [Planctomycetales bacterium]|nr:DUF2760 domain-containing protein [Planctomycetales bacterium]
MSVGVAFKAFFAALSNRQTAERLRLALQGASPPASLPETEKKPTATAPKPVASEATRSEALTLLSTLQREARFLDLVQEPLEAFEDAQIGAAAREVLRDSKKTLERMFAIVPLAEEEEGAHCQLEKKASPARYRLVGKSEGSSGTIVHRGWQATHCDVPQWSGQRSDAWILAPIEVEVA